jgi:hypothetical protein
MSSATVSPGVSAVRAYNVRVILWMIVYAAMMLAVAFAIRQGLIPAGPIRYAVAVTPALPIIGVMWAAARYMRDSDEYLRALFARRILASVGAMFILTSAWGLLEALTGAPHIQMHWVFLGFCFLYPLSCFFVRNVR